MCAAWEPSNYGTLADSLPPPFHGDEDRTFHTSNFRALYRETEAPKFQHELLNQVALPPHTLVVVGVHYEFTRTNLARSTS